MADPLRARMQDQMLNQQLATQQNLIRKYSASTGINLPPIVQPGRNQHNSHRQRPDSRSQSASHRNSPGNGARVPYSHTVGSITAGRAGIIGLPGGLSTPLFPTGAGQYFQPWGRSYYYGKLTIPAAFQTANAVVEVEPLHEPKARNGPVVREATPEIDWDGPDDSWWKKERVAIKLRHIFYVSWFLGWLKVHLAAKGKEYEAQETTDETVLFEVLIKEIIYAIHRIYLDKNSEIRRLLMEIIKTDDLTVVLREAREGAPFSRALEEVVYLLENMIFQITYIQPITGVLGTNHRSFLISLIRDGQLFPLNEFWDMEKRWLKFDHTGRTINSGAAQSALLLQMVFIARGLVWTLLMHPEDYGLAKTEPPLSGISRQNLKLMATLFLFIYRRVIIPRDTYRIPPPPNEIAHLLLDDDTIKPLVERIENSLLYCDGLIREWSNGYVRRLKQVEKK